MPGSIFGLGEPSKVSKPSYESESTQREGYSDSEHSSDPNTLVLIFRQKIRKQIFCLFLLFFSVIYPDYFGSAYSVVLQK